MTLFFILQLPELRLQDELEMWFSEDDPIVDTYKKFRDIFASDEFDLVAYESGNPFGAEEISYLSGLTARLEEVPYIAEAISLTSIDDIIGTEETLEVRPLIAGPTLGEGGITRVKGITWVKGRVEANPFIRGTLVSADGSTVGILLRVERKEGKPDSEISQIISRGIREVLAKEEKGTGRKFYLSGATIFDAEVALMIERDMERLLPITAALTAVILLVVFRSLACLVLPLICVALSLIWTLGLKGLLDSPLSPVSTSLFALIAVIGIADSIHIIQQYRLDLGRRRDRDEALLSAFEQAGWPCLLTSLTTAVGFGSLLVSRLPIIMHMGGFAAFGILSAFLLSLTIIPIGLRWTRVGPREPKDLIHSGMDASLGRIAEIGRRRPRLILAVTAVLILALGAGAFRIEVSGAMLQYFREGGWVREAAAFMDQRLGGISNLEIVLHGEPDDFKDPSVLRAVEALEELALEHPAVSASHSAVDYLKLIQRALNGDDPAHGRIPSTREEVSQSLLLYELSGGEEIAGYLTPAWDRARISLRTRDMSEEERRDLIDRIERYAGDRLARFEVELTGFTMLFDEASDNIVKTQLESLTLALVIILGLMLLNFGLRGGLISILPNLFPIIFIFGVMGYLGFPLNIGTAIIAAIAIGLVVDDTIHFFSHFRYGLGKSGDPNRAAEEAIRGVGSALCFTSLALAVGFGIFLFSECAVMVDFGILSILGIVTALLGDLFIGPVLLLRFAPPRKKERQ